MYIYIYAYIHTYLCMCMCMSMCKWGLFENYGTPKLSLRRLSQTLRALSRCSKINTWNYDHVFVCIFRLDSGIHALREPFAALSRSFATAAKIIRSYLQMSPGY